MNSNLPTGWIMRRLEDVTLSMRNGIVGTVVDRYVERGVPYLMANNVREQRVNDSTVTYIDPKFHDQHKSSWLNAGDVLTIQTGWIGVSCVVPPCFEGANAHALIISRPDPKQLNGDFLAYLLNSELGKKAIGRIKTGGGRPHLNTGDLRKLEMPIPPVSVQKKMIAALQELDKAIFSLEELCSLKRKYKMGIAKQLLTGKKRFPKFCGRAWHASSLSNHVKSLSRKNMKGCTLVLTASGEHGLVDQRRYFNRSVAGSDLSKYHLLRKGEFAYNRSAMNGYPYGATKRLDEHGEGVLSTLYLCFAIDDPKLDSDFLRHVFECGLLNRQLRPIVRVGARAHGLLNIADDDFLSISVPFPKLDEQRAIAELLSGLEHEIDLLIKKQEEFELFKRGLLSRMLSGEIPVGHEHHS